MWEAVKERNSLRAQGVNAIAVECVRWDAKRFSIVFKNEGELANFIAFNAQWGIEINRLA